MRAVLLCLFFSVASFALAAGPARPPGQPANGPGGAEYPHQKVRESKFGEGGTQYWIFEPQLPQPAKAPLIIFLHGYSAMNPEPYRSWIEHLVRRGNVVIYPRYQGELLTLPSDYHPNTAAAVRAALAVLAEPGHVAPDLTKVAAVGHSAGGIGVATFAARAAAEGLPVPKAVVAMHPGQGPENSWQLIPLDRYERIPAGTHLLLAVGEDDKFVGSGSARRIWSLTGQVKDRAFVTVPTDTHGSPVLRANHLAPLASFFGTDALDWLGYWRLFDEACAAAFADRPMVVDLGMGKWSDGEPVKALKVER